MLKLAMLFFPTLVSSSLAQRPIPSISDPASSQTSTVASQSVPQLKSKEDRKAEWQAQHHIILNVVVRDAAGAPVSHLLQKDVAVLDNAHQQTIQSFRELAGHQALEPVHGVLILDTLDNSTRELLDERRALESFLATNQGQLAYPLSLAMITDAGATVGEASQDGHALIAQLRALPLTSHLDETGGTRGTPSPIDRGSYRDARNRKTKTPLTQITCS